MVKHIKKLVTPDGESFVDFTPEEEAQVIKDGENEAARQEAEAVVAAKKESGKQKLKDLGLDDEEIKALTGA